MIHSHVFAAALVTALSVAGLAHAQKAPPNGKALYDLRCGMCHAPKAFGTLTLARRVGEKAAVIEGRPGIQPAYVTQVVRKGIGSMPPFSKVELPDDQLAAISSYLAKSGGLR